MDKIGQATRNLYAQLEWQLFEMDESDIGEENKAGWADAHCYRLARAFYIHRGKFEAKSLGITTVDGVGEALQNI